MVTSHPARTDVFHALADGTRRALLDRLLGKDLPVQDLASGFDMSRPAVSKHLRVLREADLVRERRKGRRRMYSLNSQPLKDVDDWLSSYRRFWRSNLASLKRHVEGGPGGVS
jgi:DNA-binding transcriptional ArsR family regulator